MSSLMLCSRRWSKLAKRLVLVSTSSLSSSKAYWNFRTAKMIAVENCQVKNKSLWINTGLTLSRGAGAGIFPWHCHLWMATRSGDWWFPWNNGENRTVKLDQVPMVRIEPRSRDEVRDESLAYSWFGRRPTSHSDVSPHQISHLRYLSFNSHSLNAFGWN